MNAAEVEQQLNNMRAFIIREAKEKADEMRYKAEAEFAIQKSQLVQAKRQEIQKEFEKKEKNAEMNRRIEHSNMLNAARIKVLQARETQVSAIKEETMTRLGSISSDGGKYRQFVTRSMAQALVTIGESNVTVACRPRDEGLVREVLPEAFKLANLKQAGNTPVETSLPDDSAGGVVVAAMDGRIKCDNTLEARLNICFDAMMPQVREVLFGANPNRKHIDR